MHVGAAVIFQNPGRERSDYDVYRGELRLADLVEPLGFDSIWGVEHHFTDYAMCPDVLQFLTHMAGRTQRIGLGSMVLVLPWHDPMRAAEQISMLDTISDGRVILGLGRGAGRVEFDGFRLDMATSRERFLESAQTILDGLETGYCEFEGDHVHQPRRAIRPSPFKTFRGRTYVGALSPETAPVIARLGAGLLVVPQKPWQRLEEELVSYRTLFRELNGIEAPPPRFACWTYCDESEERARELGRRHILRYWSSTLEHYGFDTDVLRGQRGYEYYGKIAETMREKGPEAMEEHFLSLQVFGTPEQCHAKVTWIADTIGADGFVGVFGFGGMPYDTAERSMRTFARDVLPELRTFAAAPRTAAA